MNLLHSPRKEHSKTEFGKKNSEKMLGELETFSGSKFSPATGISLITGFRSLNSKKLLHKFEPPKFEFEISSLNFLEFRA